MYRSSTGALEVATNISSLFNLVFSTTGLTTRTFHSYLKSATKMHQGLFGRRANLNWQPMRMHGRYLLSDRGASRIQPGTCHRIVQRNVRERQKAEKKRSCLHGMAIVLEDRTRVGCSPTTLGGKNSEHTLLMKSIPDQSRARSARFP